MKSLRALKYVLLVVLLSVSLGWKVLARASPNEPPTDRAVQVRLAEFLIRQHFSVAMAERAEQGKPALTASAGACRLLAIRSPALGWDRDLVRRYAGADDQIFIVFRGQIYADQPTFRTVIDALSSRFMRELGFKSAPSPVFAVVAQSACEAKQLPWDKFDPVQS